MMSRPIRLIAVFALTLIALTACGGGGGGKKSSDPDVAAAEFGSKVIFEGGTFNEGTPPVPDFTLSKDTVNGSTYYGGSTNPMAINVSGAISGLSPSDSITINIAFNGRNSGAAGANGFTTFDSSVSDLDAGVLNTSFTVPPDICANLADIQHQIDCYESVTLPDGTVVSTDQAQQMILACDTGKFTGSGSFCAYNYPKDACDIIAASYATAAFVSGTGAGTCDVFGDVADSYDYGYYGGEIGAVGACIIAP